MSFPFARIRTVIGGVLAGSQNWSVGFSTSGPVATPDQADLDSWAQSFADSLHADASISTFQVLNEVGANLSKVSAYYYPAGSEVSTRLSTPTFAAVAATQTSNLLPMQSSLCATVLTGIPGRSGRGRVYWPVTAAGLTAGEVSSSAADSIAELTAIIFTLLGADDVGLAAQQPIVASKTGAHVVTGVAADQRIDIQRRRADKLPQIKRPTKAVPFT